MGCKEDKHVWARMEDDAAKYQTQNICKICGKTEVVIDIPGRETDQYGNCLEEGCRHNKEDKKDADFWDNSKSHPKIKKLDK